MITVRGLRKSYSGRPVVRSLDLQAAEGEVLGILGPNGAGKTTTVEIIGGLRSIARVTGKLVPLMAVLYFACGLFIILADIGNVLKVDFVMKDGVVYREPAR